MPDNLPLPLTSFVGRDEEIMKLGQLIQQHRLVTLAGTGGVGKTRLALEVVRRRVQHYADGVWVVELGSLLDGRYLPQTVAATLGVREAKDLSLAYTLARALQPRDTLLLLDNCEHLSVACGSFVAALLSTCPSLSVMTTSREPLGVPGEIVWRVGPLDAAEGAALFAERAHAAMPEPRRTRRSVDQLCHALDGLPLAIELAAACLTFLSLDDILERLDQRFCLLTAGQRIGPARHKSLRAVVDWSYALLPTDEQQLFRSLSVFSDGSTLQALEAVCPVREPLRTLRSLVDKSLVVADAASDSSMTRYRMLETLRQYAAEKLRAAGEEQPLRQRHLEWFLALAEAGEIGLHGPRQAEWLRDLRADLKNLCAALDWSSTRPGQRDCGLRLAAAVATFWFLSGYSSQAREWLEPLLASEPDSPSRALALAKYAFVHMRRGDPASAKPAAEEALRLATGVGDRTALAEATFQLGQIALEEHDFAAAEATLNRTLDLSRDVAWPRPYAVLRHLGRVMVETGRRDRGLAHYEEGLAGARRAQDSNYVVLLLMMLARVALDLDDLAKARRYLEQCVASSTSLSGERASDSIAGMAELAAAQGDAERAFRLAGAVAGLRKPVGSALLPTAQTRLQHRLQAAAQHITATMRDAAFAGGAAMTRDQAIDYALGRRPVAAHATLLTAREREVLVLLTRGLSNRTIAERLVVSESTAKRHTEHIMSKLGVHTRAEVASWATRNGLTSGPAADDEQVCWSR